MAHIDPLDEGELSEDVQQALAKTKQRFGFIPNSLKTMARRPEIMMGFTALTGAIYGPNSVVDGELKNLVAQICSKSAGCQYCQAHTAHLSEFFGVETEKEAAIWEYETSPLFSEAERAALRVAQAAGHVPNEVTGEDMADLKKHFSDEQIVEIVAIIAMFGWLNRWNDTMATELEEAPIEAGEKFLAPNGWSTGKHAAA